MLDFTLDFLLCSTSKPCKILDSSFRKEQRRKNLLDFTCSAYWLGQNNYYPGEGTCKVSVDRNKVVFPKSFTHGN